MGAMMMGAFREKSEEKTVGFKSRMILEEIKNEGA
jgi:hypothetical protein